MKSVIIRGDLDIFAVGDTELLTVNEAEVNRVFSKIYMYFKDLEKPDWFNDLIVTFYYPCTVVYHFEVDDKSRVSQDEFVKYVNENLVKSKYPGKTDRIDVELLEVK